MNIQPTRIYPDEKMMFRVEATTKDAPTTWLTLRKFDEREEAIQHALGVNMALWDDVRVVPFRVRIQDAATLPPKPWGIETNGAGYSYLVGADGKRFATLLGTAERNRLIHEELMRLFREADAGGA